MSFQKNDNSGALFINQTRTHDKQPHLTGDALVEGKAYRMAVWKKTDRHGNTYYSVAFSEKEEQR